MRNALAADLGEAIALMLEKLSVSRQIKVVVLQANRYHRAKSNRGLGLITADEFNTTCTQICSALLDFLPEIKESDISRPSSDPEKAALLGLPAAQSSPLQTLLAGLRVDWKTLPINELHLVNSNRFNEIRTLRRALRDRNEAEQEFQFYFVNACQMQKPESFAKRVILEIMARMDEEERKGILIPSELKSGRFADLPFDFMGLADSKVALAKHFQTRFEFTERIEPVEEFLRACVQKSLGYKYITFIFSIHASKWEPFFPEYLHWILKTFSQFGEAKDLPTFLFFFPVFAHNLHETPGTIQQEVANAIVQLGQNENAFTTVISPLLPVPTEEIADWFSTELGEADQSKVEDLLLLTLQRDKASLARLEKFLTTKKADMYDVEALQREVFEFAQKQF
ncbi:MAG: hypothetical protein H7246_13290 [Phycisphaerae bacterium]|nr:hypothetical protein [Saprospiraceae bacterium]